eukprot:m.60614 g.60614  ORF g.60614 m.60614 type:complete len:131 (+) comp7954_c0_seq1:1152-1544(+)
MNSSSTSSSRRSSTSSTTTILSRPGEVLNYSFFLRNTLSNRRKENKVQTNLLEDVHPMLRNGVTLKEFLDDGIGFHYQKHRQQQDETHTLHHVAPPQQQIYDNANSDASQSSSLKRYFKHGDSYICHTFI